jgi:hypothetical protein
MPTAVLVAMKQYSFACAAVLFLAGCAAPTPSPIRLSTTSPSLTAAATPTPNPTETALTVQLPNPGGTCSASQLVEGPPMSSYDLSTVFSRVADAWQPLRNAGGSCVLAVPKVIGLAAATGPFAEVSLPNAGQQVCVNSACRTVYPTSFKIRSGQSVRIELRAWWPDSYSSSATPPPPLCAHPISDVTRAAFPLASGVIEFKWDTVFHQVCASAGTVGITLENR